MAKLKNTKLIDGSLIFKVPTGNINQRPNNPSGGEIRYNTELKMLEIYSVNGFWKTIPDISRDGLVLNLNASDPNSYPGSGFIWKDLSGVIGDINVRSRNNDWFFKKDLETNLTCLYNETNRGTDNNPGINIPMNNGFNNRAGTLDFWVKVIDNTGANGFFASSSGSSFTDNSGWIWFGLYDFSNDIYFRMSSSDTCCNDVSLTGSAVFFDEYVYGKWVNFSVSWNTFGNEATIYLNGQPFLRRTDFPNTPPDSSPSDVGQLFSGHSYAVNMQMKGYCNNYRIYNRVLSDDEITRNFEALRNRFGV